MIFYAPVRGFREVRDRAPLAGLALMALAQSARVFSGYSMADRKSKPDRAPVQRQWSASFFSPQSLLLLIAAVLVPIIAFVANIFERRGRFGLLLQQEYASLASTFLYALAIANLLTIPGCDFLQPERRSGTLRRAISSIRRSNGNLV